jgi:hypothetical protein
VALVRVVKVIKGLKKKSLLCGKVRAMDLDLEAYFLKGGKVLLSYIIALGRKMLKTLKPKVNVIKKKWMGLLQPNFKLKWANTWCKQWSKKK